MSTRFRVRLVLAHVNTNAIEAAYRRSDLFERRRALMQRWASFLAGGEGSGARPISQPDGHSLDAYPSIGC